MAALMKATALRLFNRSNFLLARTYSLAPLTDSSQHLCTRRHEGLSFQFPAGAGYASAAAHELNDDVAIPSNTNANANADRDGGEEEGDLKSSIRQSSRLQPEEAARRTKLGVDFISRYKLGNEGKTPSAGRLAEQVGGSRSWWKNFLLENEDVFSTHVDPTVLRNRSGPSAETSEEVSEEAFEDSGMPQGDDLASYAGEVLREMKLLSGVEPMSSERIEKENKSGSGEDRGLLDPRTPQDTQSTPDKKKKKNRNRNPSISVMDGIEALHVLGGGNKRELSEASEEGPMKESGEEGDVESVDEEEEEEVEEEEEEEEEEEDEEEEEEEEMEDETERNVYIRNIPSRTTEGELLEVLCLSLDGVVDVRLPKLNRSRHQFMYGFATFKSARDVQRALEVSRRTPIRFQNSALYMEPNINPKPTPGQQGRRDHSAPPYRHNSNLTEPRNQQLLYPVFLRIPQDVTIPMAEVEKELRSCGKVVGMTYQPWSGGHVVYFETNEAREYALNQNSLRETQKSACYKLSVYLLTVPTMIRISSLSTKVSQSELEKICKDCGPNPKIFRRSKYVYDVGYQVPLESLRQILKRLRRELFSPGKAVKLLKLYDPKSWEEGSRVEGGPGMMKKVLTNKLNKLESSIDFLSVEIQDFKVMLEGLDNLFGINAADTKQGVADKQEVDVEDMR